MPQRLSSIAGFMALLLSISLGGGATATLAEPARAPTQARASASATPDDGLFSIVVIPDTQMETHPYTDGLFANRTRWIVTNRAALNLKFVLHTGDVVDWDDTTHSQYERAASAMRILDSGSIPWVPSVGNHDTAAVCAGGSACDTKTTDSTVRNTNTFNRYFSVSRLPWIEGTYQRNKVDNTWSTFFGGGQQWLVLNLELWPREEVVQWASGVVRSHPGHNVLVETHAYLQADGSIGQRSEYGSTSPQYLHDNLIMPNSNIKMVFSGHVGIAANRQEVRPDGTKVVALMGTFHSERNNPTQVLTIDTAAETISTRFYAPSNGQSWPQYAATFSNVRWATTSVPAAPERKVALRSIANNRLVTAENAGRQSLIANRLKVGSWEEFWLRDLGNGKIALRSFVNDSYVCTERSGHFPLIANRSAIGPWETYQLIKNADRTVTLEAGSNGSYVTAEGAGRLPLIANRNAIGPWEKFQLLGLQN